MCVTPMRQEGCPSLVRLCSFVLGEPFCGARELESHLLACPRCQAFLKSLPGDDDLIAALRKSAAAPRPSAVHDNDLVQDLLGRLKLVDFPAGRQSPVLAPPCRLDGLPGPDDSFPFLAPPERPDELGRLGGFRVLKVLGRGGMGVVYQAEDIRLARPVALKVIRPELVVYPQMRARFLNEARAVAAVNHPNVVPIWQVGEDGGSPFHVMPLLEGESLRKRLGRGDRLPVGEGLRIGREIAEGLQAVHAAGLVHRDVKPGNVWLEARTGKALLLDFGLACRAGAAGRLDPEVDASGNQGSTLPLAGTPDFMAPEQREGSAVDGRSDLYSLGIVLREMFTGQTTLVEGAWGPSASSSGIVQEVRGLVRWLLKEDRAGRPAGAGMVAERLRALERKLPPASLELKLVPAPVPAL